MVLIPTFTGVLIAGTPPGVLPRVPDQELPGVPIEMEGFFIDRYNFPAEAGAIPDTAMTQDVARSICEKQGKRLCTELEWERACKGPHNDVYEYGSRYKPAVCGTGRTEAIAPNGVNTGCESPFGVRDMHGSAWNWTASAWGRGTKGDAVAVRGGNGKDGELFGRCANARKHDPDESDSVVGVRCCAGEPNAATVDLTVTHGSRLSYRGTDPDLARKLEEFLPDDIIDRTHGLPEANQFRVERIWTWRPVGNEELLVGGGCAHPPGHDACGVVVARLVEGELQRIDFVSSDWWIPTVGRHDVGRSLYLYGGDIGGAYRVPVVYEWGRIGRGPKERKRRGGWGR